MTPILKLRHFALAALVALTLPVSGCFVEETLNDFPDTVGFDSYYQLGRSVNIAENVGSLEGIPVMLIGPHRPTSIPIEVVIAEVNPIVGTYQAGGAYETPFVNGEHFTISSLNITIPANGSHGYIESFDSFCFPIEAAYGSQASVVLEIVGVGGSDVEIGENFKFFTTTVSRASGNNGPVATYNAGCEANNPPFFTSEPVTAAQQGQEYSYAVRVRDPEQMLDTIAGYTYDWETVTITAVTLPGWLSLSPTTTVNGTPNTVANRRRGANLTGTPTAADVGTHTVVIAATDELFTTEHTFTIEVAPAD